MTMDDNCGRTWKTRLRSISNKIGEFMWACTSRRATNWRIWVSRHGIDTNKELIKSSERKPCMAIRGTFWWVWLDQVRLISNIDRSALQGLSSASRSSLGSALATLRAVSPRNYTHILRTHVHSQYHKPLLSPLDSDTPQYLRIEHYGWSGSCH